MLRTVFLTTFASCLVLLTLPALAADFSLEKPACDVDAAMSCTQPKFTPIKTVKQSKLWDKGACKVNENSAVDASSAALCEKAVRKSRNTSHRVSGALGLVYFYQSNVTFRLNGRGLDKAKEWLAFAAKEAPDDVDVLFALGRLADFSREQENGGAAHYERMIEKFPDDWRGYYGSLWHLLNKGDLQTVESRSARMLALAPDSPIAMQVRASILERSGKTQEALELCEKAATSVAPGNSKLPGSEQEPPVWYLWAALANKINGPARAAEIMSLYVAHAKKDYEDQGAYLMRARFLKDAGQLKEAALDYDRASKLNQGMIRLEDIRIERLITLLRAGEPQIDYRDFENNADKTRLRKVLKLQVFLRNSGFNSVEINGVFDDATKKGLVDCARLKDCQAVKGPYL